MARVLVIDDDESTRDVFMALLRTAGFDAASARNGRSGILAACASTFEVILVDLQLGDMLGTEVVRELRQRGVTARMVILTAFPDLDTSFDAGRDGAGGYVDGPLFDEELADVVRQAISGPIPIRRPQRPNPAASLTLPVESLPVDPRLRTALQMIASNPMIAIDKLVSAVDLSQSRLRHMFVAISGLPIARFARRRRMQIAACLLSGSGEPVKHIGQRLGFSHFNQSFRTTFGMSPHDYRLKHSNRRPRA